MRQLTFMLADDNFADQHLVRLGLQESKRGTKLHVVQNGGEAVDYLCKRGEYADSPRPDFAILDLDMPRKNGAQVLTEIRQNPSIKGIPVAIMSGAQIPKELEAICKLNANFYIRKPDNLDSHFSVIKAFENYCIGIATSPKRQGEQADELRQVLAKV